MVLVVVRVEVLWWTVSVVGPFDPREMGPTSSAETVLCPQCRSSEAGRNACVDSVCTVEQQQLYRLLPIILPVRLNVLIVVWIRACTEYHASQYLASWLGSKASSDPTRRCYSTEIPTSVPLTDRNPSFMIQRYSDQAGLLFFLFSRLSRRRPVSKSQGSSAPRGPSCHPLTAVANF